MTPMHTEMSKPSSSECAFSQSDEVKEHKSYDFFSYTELDTDKRYENEYHIPVIPGSEMRGGVRNVYETLTDSCMGILNTDEYPVKRSMERFNPALMCREQNGTFSLYDARSLRIGEAAPKGKIPEGFETYSNGTLIYYQEPDKNDKGQLKAIEKYCVEPGVYPRKGYLLKWGMGVKKSRYHVFIMKRSQSSDGKVQGIQLSKDTVEETKLRIRMKSPMTVYSTDHENGRIYYYNPEEEEFYQRLNENFFRKYQAYYGVEPISMLEIQKEGDKIPKKFVTRYQGSYITAWYGTYELSGERKYLDFLYQTGLGSKNSQGFGMFEIL